MDTIKTGRFIKTLRQEEQMTQRDLGDRIGVSDKTISKWETGAAFPPADMLVSLSSIFGISLNELIAGEKLKQDSFEKKADENLSILLSEAEDRQVSAWKMVAVGILLIVVSAVWGHYLNGLAITTYIDFPTILIMTGIMVGILCITKSSTWRRFFRTFRKTVIPLGIMLSLAMLSGFFRDLADLSSIGPNISVALLPLLYAALSYFVVTVAEIIYSRKTESCF